MITMRVKIYSLMLSVRPCTFVLRPNPVVKLIDVGERRGKDNIMF